jgi:DNA topoisomerase I
MGKQLVIVESPTKAKTIGKFLGKDFDVVASYGHVRDLPQSATEIPTKVKKEKWARIGVNVDSNFEPLYVIPGDKKKRVQELEKLLVDAEMVLLATDEDREGESISWHLLEVLKPKVAVKRLVFHEITKEAIRHALENTRSIDENLVRAQETRRIVDRLFGYTVSPLLWKKMAPRLSAGRVQSVAIRLLVERERERIKFRAAQYSDLEGTFITSKQESFDAAIISLDKKRIAIGKDFDPTTGALTTTAAKEVVLLNHNSASALRDALLSEKGMVESIDEKAFTSSPPPPFTTSTLQQEGARKLNHPVRRTMQIAQSLYENGFITYMRTDSTNLSQEAISAARGGIEQQFGKEFLPSEPRHYRTKVKNAQEAHEAIRPAGVEFALVATVRTKLGEEAARLYDLIWKRTMACQMKDAHGTRVLVHVALGNAIFRASGKSILFPGFLRAYVEGADDPQAELADKEKILPVLKKGDKLDLSSLKVLDHVTQPSPRYTEGSLIKELERRGIGRPSTWATIVDVVLSREYAFKKGTALVPTFLASAVTGLLERYFDKVIDYEFTAHLEEDLDAISRGEAQSLEYLREFYHGSRPGLSELVRSGEEVIDPRVVCGLPIGEFEGKIVEVRIGRYGPFLTDGERKASISESFPPDELSLEKSLALLSDASKKAEALGVHPASGLPIYVKVGRFGPYIQEGELIQGSESKPKMASLLPSMKVDDVTFEDAVTLLSFPKTLGEYPLTPDSALSGKPITAANGRYGPYIKCGTDTRTIPESHSLLTYTYDDAVLLLQQPKVNRRAAPAKSNLKDLGPHPVTQKNLVIKSGRYGPYVTDGTLNASLPRGSDPLTFSTEEAVTILESRALQIAENPTPAKKTTRSKKVSAKK